MKKTETKQNRPDPFLYFIARLFFMFTNITRFNLHVRGVTPKGPAIVLSNHTSNQDFKYIVSACSPNRVSFLCTYHFFTFKKLKFWLDRIGAIPKHQFSTDFSAMKKMKYLLQKKKGLVYIAPEGTIYANGKLGYMSPSIAKLIKSFKVPVYTSLIEGAGLGNAKWSLQRHRGYVRVTTSLFLTPEEEEKLSVNQIMEKLYDALSYNDFDFQKEINLKVPGIDRAEGFDTMFYKCPCCEKEFTLSSKGNEIECSFCHTKANLTQDYRFKWNGKKQYFDNYIQWYDWQYHSLKQQMLDDSFELKEEVDFAIDEPGKDNYFKIGHGTMTFNHSGWTYEGTADGKQITDHDNCNDVFLATLKIGKHFELPMKDGHCRVYYPVKDGRTSMKWHLASRIMAEINGQ